MFSAVHLDIVGGVLRKNEDLDEARKKRARQIITLKKDTLLSVLRDQILVLFGHGKPILMKTKIAGLTSTNRCTTKRSAEA